MPSVLRAAYVFHVMEAHYLLHEVAEDARDAFDISCCQHCLSTWNLELRLHCHTGREM